MLKKLSTSKQLIKNTKHFLNISPFYGLGKNAIFYGWGRKNSGFKAIKLATKYNSKFILLEDGFIRSVNLGVEKEPSFSLVEDSIGIYYDATMPSELENILLNYDFKNDEDLLKKAKFAIELIKKHNISKYNNGKIITDEYFNNNQDKVLIIAQTKNDSSLLYGYADKYSTNDMINIAINENPNAAIYLKIHPDVLSGKKDSDIDLSLIPASIQIIQENINPISLLKHFKKVYTKTSQMGFEAILLGVECVCFGVPFYSNWGISDDRIKCDRRARILSKEEVFAAAYILYSKYVNPYTYKQIDIIQAIKSIISLKRFKFHDKTAYFFGFSRWKHGFVRDFLKEYKSKNIYFINSFFTNHYKKALSKGMDKNSDIFIWGIKEFKKVEEFARKNNINITRVEDGFIRSVGLGSSLTRPYSLVFDTKGIYFNPQSPSLLEDILNNYTFDEDVLIQAKKLKQKIIKTKISKYNLDKHIKLNFPKDKVKILIPGQVEDDASIKFGANGMKNIELLKAVRDKNKNAFIIYKPHPDVVSGNRIGKIDCNEALKYADKILIKTSLNSILQEVDEVHTMTSLSGFEGLLYDKKVFTYGLPFYANWGLTYDQKICTRRKRKISLDELIAATYIIYPRYLHPKTLGFIEADDLIDEMQLEQERLQNSKMALFKFKFYCFFSNNLQKIASFFR